jgi:hypothetical protein
METVMVFRMSEHDIFRGNGTDTFWYQFATSRVLDDSEVFRAETAVRSCLQPRQEFDQEDYELINPINFFGTFIPVGTKYVRVNPDEWYPIINDARCPSYALDFTIVRNNLAYFKPITLTPKP